MGRLYLAYGSNLNLEQMKYRCPNSKVYGKAWLKDYRLAFHGAAFNAHATIIPAKGHKVPVLIWQVSKNDEMNLDRYEGFPNYYFKKDVVAVMETGEIVTAMAYIMDKTRPSNFPSKYYVDTIAQGYRDCGMDDEYLQNALEQNVIEVNENCKVRRCPKCGDYYSGHPAMSRIDGSDICPSCGIHEALGSFLDYIDNTAVNA